MKNIFRISGVILLILSIFLVHSCKKDKPTPPIITTEDVFAISYTTATSGGDLTSLGGAPILSMGVCWNKSANPTTANSETTGSGGLGTFTSNLTQLIPNTLYYVRAYATNSASTGYGNQVTFTTSQIALATLTTAAITSITQTTAVSGGTITADNGGTITARGVCWSIVTNPTTNNRKTIDGTGTGIFVSTLTGLTGDSTYYVRAYATNSAGTQYGNQVSFTTNPLLPTLTTVAISLITGTTCTSGGNISSDGGAAVTARGVCWSTGTGPTTANSKTTDGTGTGSFTSSVTGLTANTMYYLKAYATNSVGTSYGSELTFTTLGQVPTVTTLAATNINTVAAQLNGIVNANYLSTVVTFEYGTTINYGNTITAIQSPVTGNTSINVSGNVSGLTVGSTYHFRVKAINSLGTSNGSDLMLTTSTTVTDIDGNIYNTITIGTQTWLAENLLTTKYNDGTAIPNITDGTAWNALTTGTYSDYSNTPANSTTYGRLYNWFAVDNNSATKVASNGGKNVCPTGWHVPTDAEWTTLTDYLIANGYNWDGTTIGNNIAKSMASTSDWPEYTEVGTVGNDQARNNGSGFTALPGGYRYVSGCDSIGEHGFWWSYSEYSTTSAWIRDVGSRDYGVGRSYYFKVNGFSVRCLKDY